VLGACLFCHAGIIINGKSDPGLDKSVLAGLEHLQHERFSRSLRVFEKIKGDYPDHPVGYFLVAVALDAKMYFYCSSANESEFMKNCEQAIEVGERLLQKTPDDKWLLFFTGGAYGYMGTYKARYKNYITSFRNGWTGVSMLKKIYKKDKTFVDVLLGLGTYNFWSSKFSKALWWMPGLSDKRELGINQLKKVVQQGEYTRYAAWP
jgi:hypothetical protein